MRAWQPRVPWREDDEVALRVRDRALAPIDSRPSSWAPQKFDARFSGTVKFRETVFRVRLPRDERNVIF